MADAETAPVTSAAADEAEPTESEQPDDAGADAPVDEQAAPAEEQTT
jgi:hypothetical protein